MTTTPVPTEASGMTLTAADRCDRCGARAVVVTDHDGTHLLWCGHHFTEHEDALVMRIVLDQREKHLT